MPEYRVFNTAYEQAQASSIAASYSQGLVKGWDKDIAAEAFKIVGQAPGIYEELPRNMVDNAKGNKMFLYRVVRKVLGQDTKNYPQQIGDCVAFGMKNAIEYLICCEKLMKGDREMFRPIYPPYLYGTGRVYIGKGRLGNSDGSMGSWMAEAVIKYGTIPADEQGIPSYAGNVSKKWGAPSGASELDKWKPLGEKHLVKSAAKIGSWADLVAAITNGYPCTVASDQGFSMEAGSDGFHKASGSWAHQMCIMGVDDSHSTPYALILNSWGDAHGHLKALDGEDDLPIGVIRAKKSTVERMINAGETFAISGLDGFPEKDLNEALFKIVGS